jgi:hypothetical protein
LWGTRDRAGAVELKLPDDDCRALELGHGMHVRSWKRKCHNRKQEPGGKVKGWNGKQPG